MIISGVGTSICLFFSCKEIITLNLEQMLAAIRNNSTRVSFLGFLNKYGFSLFVVLPLWTAIGMVSRPLLLVVAPLMIFFMYYRGMQDQIIILLFSSLILGDSRYAVMGMYETLRYDLVIVITILSILDYFYGKAGFQMTILWILPFIVSACMSLIDSPVGMRGFSKTMAVFLIYFVGLNFIFNYVKILNRTFVVEFTQYIHFALGLGLLFAVFFPDIAYWAGSMRYKGVFGNPNGVGAFTAFSFIFCVIVFPYLENQIDDRFKKWTWALIIFTLLLCASRNSIGTVLIFIVLRASFEGNVFRRLLMIFGLLPLFALLSGLFSFADVVEFFGLESFLRVDSIGDGSGRTLAWGWAMTEIAKYPLMGRGYTWDDILFFAYIPKEILAKGHFGGVHNSYLVFIINTGFVGIILYFVFFFRLMFSIRTIKNMVPFMVAIMFSAMFESWLSASLNFLNTYFILIWVVTKLAEDDWDIRIQATEAMRFRAPARIFSG